MNYNLPFPLLRLTNERAPKPQDEAPRFISSAKSRPYPQPNCSAIPILTLNPTDSQLCNTEGLLTLNPKRAPSPVKQTRRAKSPTTLPDHLVEDAENTIPILSQHLPSLHLLHNPCETHVTNLENQVQSYKETVYLLKTQLKSLEKFLGQGREMATQTTNANGDIRENESARMKRREKVKSVEEIESSVQEDNEDITENQSVKETEEMNTTRDNESAFLAVCESIRSSPLLRSPTPRSKTMSPVLSNRSPSPMLLPDHPETRIPKVMENSHLPPLYKLIEEYWEPTFQMSYHERIFSSSCALTASQEEKVELEECKDKDEAFHRILSNYEELMERARLLDDYLECKLRKESIRKVMKTGLIQLKHNASSV